MRRNLIYSFIVFLLLFVYIYAGALTSFIMKGAKLEDVIFSFVFFLAFCAFIALISFFPIRAIRKRFSSKQDEPDYRPSRSFISIASVFVAISLIAGVSNSYFVISEERQAAESAKNAAETQKQKAAALAEAQKQKAAALAEAERLRVAGLTAEQRDAEAKLKDEQAKIAADAAATAAKLAAIAAEVAAIEASRKEQARVAEIRERAAIKAKENHRSTMAVLAVRTIKRNLRNPDSVKWGDVRANEDGIVCVEYRAQNGFGGMSIEYVVFINGELRRDSTAWNKNCANKKLYDETDFALRMVDR